MLPLPALHSPAAFPTSVLPGLLRTVPSLTHIVASYNRIGIRRPSRPYEIYRDNGLTTLTLPELTPGRILSDASRVLESETDRFAPMIATVYVGNRLFVEMLLFVSIVLKIRPSARVIALSCPCITTDQEEILRRGMQSGKLASAAWCDCGGRLMIRDIDRAVRKNWTPAEADIQLSPLSTEASVDLGA